MYKVIEERKEIEESVNTIIYEYDHESLDSAMKHIDLRSTQDCKCYIGSNDEKSKYRRSLMELDKEELVEKLIKKSVNKSKICSIKIHGRGYLPDTRDFILGKCDLYVTSDNNTFEKISDVEVTVRS